MPQLSSEQIEALGKYISEIKKDENRSWHEEQKKSTIKIRQLLANAQFENGKDLSLEELAKLADLLLVGLGSITLYISIEMGKNSMFKANPKDEVSANV